MEIPVPAELIGICKRILEQGLALEQWSAIECGDMFQSGSLCGGFEAIEKAFSFSYYDIDGQEYWFQISLPEVEKIASGSITTLRARLPS